ncbi:2-Hydroxyacid oxidase 2-like [Saccoglossus kowalevskii]|uniref:Hydroxyacid oxidase 2-like n=1 Tax=Saccoglossus kowalevskii TaxID=10224 RepID=A0ABM0GPD6_SACKO|nr:PREDICTED: hydroxyacid oxidase 2-like [Saccoglossus kowalevskii]
MAADAHCVCLDDFEKYAEKHLSLMTWIYYCSGADGETTLKENRRSFRRIRLKPRVLRDVSTRDLKTTILGREIDIPICISPTAFQGLAHPDAEAGTSRASGTFNTCMILSSVSSLSLEDICCAHSGGTKWMDIYVWPNPRVTKDMVQRAEQAGCKGIVVSVDICQVGFKRRMAYVAGDIVPRNAIIANFDKYCKNGIMNETTFLDEVKCGDPSATWADIDWIKSITKLPIILKGIMTVEDALIAVEHKVNAIMVSNHGGRQLDGVPATIDVLAEISKAVGDKIEVYMDGGVRTGTDVLKALALGARAVFIGRPVIYGLAYKGEEGVKNVLQILKDELSLAMALSGCRTIKDINESIVMEKNLYCRL